MLFMIACDHCGQWFHGACVEIQPDQNTETSQWYVHATTALLTAKLRVRSDTYRTLEGELS